MSFLFVWLFHIKIIDIIDILLVAVLLYQLHKLIKGTSAIFIFIGILSIYILWKIAIVLEMKLLNELLGQCFRMGFLALIIIFQPEIRKFLLMLGTPKLLQKIKIRNRKNRWQIHRSLLTNLDSIVLACKDMAARKTGSLIVITKNHVINHYIETGQKLDAFVSKEILESIFHKESPLHDGAVIISGNKIKAVRCILPVSEKTDIPQSYGLRHRAGIGVTEHSDAIAIITSEQTGKISFCCRGKIVYDLSPSDLKLQLKKEVKE